MTGRTVVRCLSCDGVGWYTDEETDDTITCDWCDGAGYVYRDHDGVDHRIPHEDYGALSDILEQLEIERLREMGYTGEAKKPWEQDVRKGTKGGVNPYT